MNYKFTKINLSFLNTYRNIQISNFIQNILTKASANLENSIGHTAFTQMTYKFNKKSNSVRATSLKVIHRVKYYLQY